MEVDWFMDQQTQSNGGNDNNLKLNAHRHLSPLSLKLTGAKFKGVEGGSPVVAATSISTKHQRPCPQLKIPMPLKSVQLKFGDVVAKNNVGVKSVPPTVDRT